MSCQRDTCLVLQDPRIEDFGEGAAGVRFHLIADLHLGADARSADWSYCLVTLSCDSHGMPIKVRSCLGTLGKTRPSSRNPVLGEMERGVGFKILQRKGYSTYCLPAEQNKDGNMKERDRK